MSLALTISKYLPNIEYGNPYHHWGQDATEDTEYQKFGH